MTWLTIRKPDPRQHPSWLVRRIMELRCRGWEKTRIVEALRDVWPVGNINKVAGIVHRNRDFWDVPELSSRHGRWMMAIIVRKAWATRKRLYGERGRKERHGGQ